MTTIDDGYHQGRDAQPSSTSLDKPSALDKFREWCKNDETILDEGVVGGALDEIEALRKIEEGA